MKNSSGCLLFVSTLALLLSACASQAPVPHAAATPAAASTAVQSATTAPDSTAATPKPANGGQGVTVVSTRYSGTRRVFKDGVEYFCERPAAAGSHFISAKEQCYTEAQLKALREHDQDMVRRQQEMALQSNTKAVQRGPLGSK